MSTQNTDSLAEPTYYSDLGHGLIRRWSTAADQAKIGHLFASVHRESADAPLNERPADVARILMSPGFPYMDAGDFAVVEDSSRPERPIVAATALWRLQWRYADIPFVVGQPEMVATDAGYRNRGLVRALFEMIHGRSTAEGHLVQAITGIAYYYRLFGYEYVLDLEGERIVNINAIPQKSGAEAEPYHLRSATLADIPTLKHLYTRARRDSLVWHEATDAYWRHHVTSWDEAIALGLDALKNGLYGRLYMIVHTSDEIAGYTWLTDKRWDHRQEVLALEMAEHVNWQHVMPSLLRAIHAHGQQVPTVKPDAEPVREIGFKLGRAHPFYAVLGDELAPRFVPPYAWYLRVADVPAFIRHIAPVLEERIAKSILRGHTGELKFDFYRGGLRLVFAQGKLAAAEPWRVPEYGHPNDAGCPALIFLQLLFGYRSLAELRAIFPDVDANQDAILLIETLFPKLPSAVQPLMTT